MKACQSARPGDPAIERAARAIQATLAAKPRARIPVAVRNARGMLTAGRQVVCTPRISVEIEDNPSGRALAEVLRSRLLLFWKGRPCLSVIDVRDGFSAYFSSPARQQVRTRCNQAQRLGLEFSEITSEGRRRQCAKHLIDMRAAAGISVGNEDWFLHRRLDRMFVVADPDGTCLALASVAVHATSAFLVSALATADRSIASTARYSLHTYALEVLAVGGVSWLWADGPLTLPGGLQRYQRLLGYHCATPRLKWVSVSRG